MESISPYRACGNLWLFHFVPPLGRDVMEILTERDFHYNAKRVALMLIGDDKNLDRKRRLNNAHI